MIVQCVIAGNDAHGDADFTFVMVECTEGEYEDGLAADAAMRWARNEEYGPALVVYDDRNRHRWLLEFFVWESATVIPTSWQPP